MLDVIRWLKKLYTALGQVSDLIYAHKARHRPGGGDPLFPADFSILPATDNTYDLGSSTYRWANLYLANIANIGSLQIGGTTVIDSSKVLQNIASVSQSLTPSADNSYDLGSSSYRWRTLYAVSIYGALISLD